MDTRKLCDLLLQEKTLDDIPVIYILRVACAVLELISRGECFYDREEVDSCS